MLLVPAGGQFGSACALWSIMYQESQPSAGFPSTEPWLLWSFSSGQFGISSVQWIFEPEQGLLSCPFPV